ncbi:MAG: hypothetical protein AB1758_32785, partial [Candidatus Eremiobacterota bacterium]
MRTLALLLLLLALPALGQADRGPQPGAAGVYLNGSVVRPGDQMGIVLGVAGPPDFVRAVRNQKPEDDYVLFSYPHHGVSFDINSTTNRVQGILVEATEARLDGLPFRIGDTQQSVTSSWGQPERTEVGMLVYWRRGVYLGLDNSGRIIRVFLTEPGR